MTGPKPVRVAMLVINAFTHDTRVQKEARALTKAGYEVMVFALHDTGLPERQARDGYWVERIRVRSRGWGTLLFIRMLKYLEFSIRAIRRIVRLQPDVVHAHDVNALLPAYVAARLANARLVYDAHELWAERRAIMLRSDSLRRFVKFVEGTLARRADAVVTVNSSIARFLADQYNLSSVLALMHCQEYAAVERNDILRQEFDIPTDRRIVIYAGLIGQGRGIENLILSAHHLDRAVILIMGPNRLGKQLHDLIAQQGLESRVFIREPVLPSEVTRYVSSADLGVIPTQNVDLSYYYGSGNKLFHYLTAGIPAAVSNHPEKRRIVKTYSVGVVFDETDPQDIARVINRLLNDEQTYRAMSQRAREVSRDVLNWETESRKLLTLYERLTREAVRDEDTPRG